MKYSFKSFKIETSNDSRMMRKRRRRRRTTSVVPITVT